VTKHARFLQIEHASADAGPESESADRARIAAVLQAAPVSTAGSSSNLELAEDAPAGDGRPPDWGARVARIVDAPGMDGAADGALDVEKIEGQPFVRCARCGTDSSIHAAECDSCSARLDTPEQRAFNERVWDAQLRRSASERAALEELSAARVESARSALRPLPDSEGVGDEEGPLLLGALLTLRNPRWRWVAGVLAVGLPIFFVVLGGPVLAKIGWFLVALLMLSLLPRTLGRRLLELWAGFRQR
jgi:hypothetical protein